MAKKAQPESWWHTAPGIITAIAGLITAVGGLLTVLVQVGWLGDPRPRLEAVTQAPPAPVGDSPDTDTASENSALTVDELEERLDRINIAVSTGGAAERIKVRGYINDPETPYKTLAHACLDALEGRRLKEQAHLDMIDKWYTRAVRPKPYLVDGKVRRPELEHAIVQASNEMHGTTARSLKELIEPRR